MKRIIIALAALAVLSTNANAQTKKGKAAKKAISKEVPAVINAVKGAATPMPPAPPTMRDMPGNAPTPPGMPGRLDANGMPPMTPGTAPTPVAGMPQNPTPIAPAVVYEFDKYLKIDRLENDFGTIPEGPKAVTKFIVTNISKEPITIERVQASCGCTVPSWDKEPIAPGKTGSFTAEFNTVGKSGAPFSKSLTLFTTRGQKAVIIKGNVTPAPKVDVPTQVIDQAPVKH